MKLHLSPRALMINAGFTVLLSVLLLAACSKDGDKYLRTETIIVASEKRMVNSGVGYEPSLIVKSPGGKWEYFYNSIENFNWEEGYEYELRVKVYEIEEPLQDSSSLRYVLKEEVSKTRKKPEGLPDDQQNPYQ